MNLEQIIPALALVAVLILVLPSFIETNIKKKNISKKSNHLGYYCFNTYDTFKFNLLMKKINLGVTGCMGRMGQQIIKSVKSNKNFKLVALTEIKEINKKIHGIKISQNTLENLKKTNLIIDFTIPKCTFEILKIATKLKKRVVIGTTGFTKKEKLKLKNIQKNSNFESW